MERFNSELYLTSSQAAELLNVHPSTVKRWCNEGELAFDKTDGGHRRIHLTDLLELSRVREIETFLDSFAPYEGHVWSAFNQVVDGGSFHRVHALAMGWLNRAHMNRLTALFAELGRRPGISFERFADEGIRGFMSMVGDAWREGRLRVGEEHMMTEAMSDVLFRLRDVGASPDGDRSPGETRRAPRCAIVGTMEGHRHGLGSMCARILLERRGWDVYFLGADVPVEDFAALQKSRKADLVCVSFSPPAIGADMRRCVRILAEFYDHTSPYSLALGGDLGELLGFGGEDYPFERLAAFSTIGDMSKALATGFAGHPAAVGGA